MTLRSIIDTIAFPALMAGQAAELMALLRQFDASQHWPAERMQTAQFTQLAHVLKQAATIPFHDSRLKAAGIDPNAPLTMAAWRRLPVMTRTDLQENGPALHAPKVHPEHGTVSEVASGGSTGQPVSVRKTGLETMLWMALQLREEDWNRENPAATIARLGAEYLFLFPSTLRTLLAHCRDNAIRFPALRSVWTLSEVVDPDLRALCREVLGVRIVDNYSAAECGYIALQCPETDHYHVQSETVLVEVVDTQGNPCAPGETGRVLITPLHNFAMPLLRYAIGDEAELGGPCQCGRHLPVLTRIAALRAFQIIQRSRTDIEIIMMVARPLDATDETAVRAALVKSFGPEFRYTLTYRDTIPRTAADKLRSFVCEAQ